MTHVRTALIVGGGVAGPVTAIALQKAGIEPVIYEARSTAPTTGAFLTLGSNGIDALRVLGADTAALAAGFPTPRIVLRSGTGKRLGETRTGLTPPDGTTSHTLTRADLYRALHEQAEARGVRVEFDRRMVAAEETSDGVRVKFADGSEAFGDLLVGCDGVHSTTRRIIDPDAPAPTYAGLLNAGGYVRGARMDAEPGSYEMIFGKRAFFGHVVAPGGDVWWFANLPRRDEPARSELEAISEGQLRRQLAAAFADDEGPALRLIDATSEITPLTAVHTLPRLPRWHTDRIVVLGDAAHAPSPSSGQGASLSIEDAIVLAKCLRDAPTPREALASFEAVRRPRAEAIIKWAARVNNAKAAGPVGRVIRDAMTPLFLSLTANSKSHQQTYNFHIDWDTVAVGASSPSLKSAGSDGP